MNAVIFYSNTSQSKSLAEYLAHELGYQITDIDARASEEYQNLVLVFPVHCQNLPNTVKSFLKNITAENLTVVATYGKMCPGNVLYEIQNKYNKSIVAAAYVPTKHSYIEDDVSFSDYNKLSVLVEKVKNPSVLTLPRLYKNPLANVFPSLRSRLGLKILRTQSCNGCNACTQVCPLDAMHGGITSRHCIRCLRCVSTCPRQALAVKPRLPLKLYLQKKKSDKLIIYV